jgi:transcriptional regulator with XRE-family HTH domain
VKINEQIKLMRKDAGLTQEQMAAKLKTTQSVISRIESSNYAGYSIVFLRRVAKVFGAKLVVNFE